MTLRELDATNTALNEVYGLVEFWIPEYVRAHLEQLQMNKLFTDKDKARLAAADAMEAKSKQIRNDILVEHHLRDLIPESYTKE